MFIQNQTNKKQTNNYCVRTIIINSELQLRAFSEKLQTKKTAKQIKYVQFVIQKAHYWL